MDYRRSGVDVELAETIKVDIKKLVPNIGLFSGLYQLNQTQYLASSIDGVGTKIKWASPFIIGQDIVNHCVNDLMCCGADPLFFLDYIASSRLDSKKVQQFIQGIVKACAENNCILVGGETAEMPSVYSKGSCDLVGCSIGIVNKGQVIDGTKIEKDNVVIGILSSGLHTNGYSLIRKIFKKTQVKDELFKVHKSYYCVIQRIRNYVGLRGIAHITGGGLISNIKRLLPKGLDVSIDWDSWPVMAIFERIGQCVDFEEMKKIFNMGIGLAIIVDKSSVPLFLKSCENSYVIGKIITQQKEN